jgi:hypothetical protein
MDELSSIKERGISLLDYRFDARWFNTFMQTRPAFHNHVRQGKPAAPWGSHPWMCRDPHDSVRAPGLLEMALWYLPLARQVLEAEPFLYSLNTFYTWPNWYTKADIQEFHRDQDDAKFLAFFVYLTDVVEEADGPHQFKIGTQYGAPDGPVESIYGPAGSVFAGLTYGLHRGVLPKRGIRAVAWARYGISDPPPAYQWDGLTPLPKAELGDRYPSDPVLQKAIHLVAS